MKRSSILGWLNFHFQNALSREQSVVTTSIQAKLFLSRLVQKASDPYYRRAPTGEPCTVTEIDLTDQQERQIYPPRCGINPMLGSDYS